MRTGLSNFYAQFKWPKARLVMAVAGGLLFLFLVLPLLALIVRALRDLDGAAVLFGRPVLSAVLLSLGTTAVSVVLILFFGTPLAYVLARYQFPFKQVVNVLVELPIIMPPVVAGLALLMAFGRRGLLGPPLELLGITLPFTTTAVIIAQTFVAAPFFIRTAQVRFRAVPRDLEEAASMDGATTGTVFRYIALPLSAPGLLAGLLLSWARALGEFGATILFAGSLQGVTQTMPLLVYGALERNLNEALWSGLLLVGLALLALLIVRWLTHSLEDSDPLAEA